MPRGGRRHPDGPVHPRVGARSVRPSAHHWTTPCSTPHCRSWAMSGLQHCRMHLSPSEDPVEGLRIALDRELGIKAHNALKRLSESRRTVEATRRAMAENLTTRILVAGPMTVDGADHEQEI